MLLCEGPVTDSGVCPEQRGPVTGERLGRAGALSIGRLPAENSAALKASPAGWPR